MIISSSGGRLFQDFYELLDFLGPDFNPAWCNALDEKGMVARETYKDNETFIRESTVFGYQGIGLMFAGIHRPYIAKVLNVCADRSPVSLLDVGAGSGQLALAFHSLGFIVSLADVQSKSLLFAEWRLRRRGLDLPVYVLDYESKVFPDVPPQSVITCFDVMEHMEFEVQKRLLTWMGNRSTLVFTNLIIDDSHPEMHLRVDVDGLVTHVAKKWKYELAGYYPDAAGNPRQYLLVYGPGVKTNETPHT